MEAILLSAISMAGCAQAVVFHWITHFGVPDMITSDRWPQFTLNLWAELCDMLNCIHGQVGHM
jgi:hypothetical protein